MKFTVSKTDSKKPAKVDVVAIEQALVESYEAMGAAYENLMLCGEEASEFMKVMEDCKMATESISKFGITPAAMDLFNGDKHILDRALGFEDLAVESIASLSKDAKDLLKKNYKAGLEGQFADALKAFLTTVKRWFAQFANWIREVFNGNAKMIRLVQELKFENLDADKTVKVIPQENVKLIHDLVMDLEQALKSPIGNDDISKSTENLQKAQELLGEEFMGKVAKAIEKKEGTVSELKWTADACKTAARDFEKLGASVELVDGWKKAQAEYNATVKLTGQDKTTLEKARLRFDFVKMRGKAVSIHTKLVRALGTSLMTLAKATKKAETK